MAEEIGHDYLKALLKQAFGSSNCCAKVWLGHDDALLLGFGPEILPPPVKTIGDNGKPHFIHPAKPKFEIVTEASVWRLTQKGILLAEDIGDARIELEDMSPLLGRQVMNWSLGNPAPDLTIQFEDGLTLSIFPYISDDTDDVLMYAWGIWEDGDFVTEVTWNGIVTKSYKDEPI